MQAYVYLKEPTRPIWMKIDPHYHQQKVVQGVRVWGLCGIMGIRTGFLGGVGERQWGGRKAISVLWLPIASEPSRDKAEIDYMVIHV